MVIYAVYLTFKQKMRTAKSPKTTGINIWGEYVVGSNVMEKLVCIILCKYASHSFLDAMQTCIPLCFTI